MIIPVTCKRSRTSVSVPLLCPTLHHAYHHPATNPLGTRPSSPLSDPESPPPSSPVRNSTKASATLHPVPPSPALREIASSSHQTLSYNILCPWSRSLRHSPARRAAAASRVGSSTATSSRRIAHLQTPPFKNPRTLVSGPRSRPRGRGLPPPPPTTAETFILLVRGGHGW